MPDPPDAFLQGFVRTFFQKSWNVQNWKIRTKEYVLCNLNEFSHVVEEHRKKNGDLDAVFQYFVVLTDLTKNMDKPLKKMPDLPASFFQGFAHTFFQKSWNDENWKIRTKECVLCNMNEFSHVAEENCKTNEDLDADF